MEFDNDEHALEYACCESDPLYFINNYCHIKDQLKKEDVLFKLWPEQEKIFGKMVDRAVRFIIGLKGRQVGITTGCGAVSLQEIIFNPYSEVLFISRNDTIAKEALERVRYMYDRLPDWLRVPTRKKPNQREIALTNHSSIRSIPTTRNAGISKTVNLLILDEAANGEFFDMIYSSAFPTLSSSGGRIFVVSSIERYAPSIEFFKDIWYAAVDGENDYVPIFLPWTANPNRDAEWYETERRNLKLWGDEVSFKRSHPSRPEEALMLGGRCAFNIDLLVDQIERLEKNRPKYRVVEMAYLPEGVRPVDNTGGIIRIYHEPVFSGEYVIGCDVAEGLPKGDNSALYVRNAKNWRVEASLVGHIDPLLFGHEIHKLAVYYNDAFVGVERNAAGNTTMTYLEDNYHNLYVAKNPETRKPMNRTGWYTSRITKDQMIKALLISIQDKMLICDEAEFWKECTTFQVNEKGAYGAIGKVKDDRVIAMAISEMMLAERPKFSSRYDPAKQMREAKKKYNEMMFGSKGGSASGGMGADF